MFCNRLIKIKSTIIGFLNINMEGWKFNYVIAIRTILARIILPNIKVYLALFTDLFYTIDAVIHI